MRPRRCEPGAGAAPAFVRPNAQGGVPLDKQDAEHVGVPGALGVADGWVRRLKALAGSPGQAREAPPPSPHSPPTLFNTAVNVPTTGDVVAAAPPRASQPSSCRLARAGWT